MKNCAKCGEGIIEQDFCLNENEEMICYDCYYREKGLNDERKKWASLKEWVDPKCSLNTMWGNWGCFTAYRVWGESAFLKLANIIKEIKS